MKIKNHYSNSFLFIAIITFFSTLNGEVFNQERFFFTSRTDAVKYVLDHFHRPVTVLEVGAREGDTSFQIAQSYDSVCVMTTDPNLNNNSLQRLCEEKDLSNVILLSKKLTLEELQNLSECEHFDVVMAFHLEEDYGKDAKKALSSIFLLGNHILVEASSPTKDPSSCINYLKIKMGLAIGEYPDNSDPQKNHSLCWVFNPRYDLKRKGYCLHLSTNYHHWVIKSTYEEKKLQKFLSGNFASENPWLPGINLLTYKFLHGTFPSKETLKQSIELLSTFPSNDWLPHNMIVQGKHCILIDCADAHVGPLTPPFPFTEENLLLIKEFIDEEDPEKLKECKLLPKEYIKPKKSFSFSIKKLKRKYKRKKKLMNSGEQGTQAQVSLGE